MKIYRDTKAKTPYGNGTNIELDGAELAHAINSYLYAIGVVVSGARTITVASDDGLGESWGLCAGAKIYVDPSGRVIKDDKEVK